MKRFITLCLCLLLCSVLIIGMSNAQQNDDNSEYTPRRSNQSDRKLRRIRREKLINQVEILLKELKKLHLEEELADSMNLPSAECLRCLAKKDEDLKAVIKNTGFVSGSMRCMQVCVASF